METHPTNNDINRKATIIERKLKIVGNVVIAMMTIEPHVEFQDLTIELFEKILAIMSDSSFSRQMSDSEDKNIMSSSSQNTKVSNFYRILNDRYAQYKKTHSDKFIDIIPDDVLNGPIMNFTLNI